MRRSSAMLITGCISHGVRYNKVEFFRVALFINSLIMSEMEKRYARDLAFLQEVSLVMTNSGCTRHRRAPAFVLPGQPSDYLACRLHFAFVTLRGKPFFTGHYNSEVALPIIPAWFWR